MTNVYCCLYRGQGIGGWLVRRWTRSAYGHCSVLVVDDACIGTVYEAVAGGVSKRPTGRYEWGGARIGNPPYTVILPCPWVDAERQVAWAETRLGCKYDWWAVVMSGLVLRWPGGWPSWARVQDVQQGRYDCSRFCAEFLGLIDYADPCPPTPGGVYDRVRARLAEIQGEGDR